jgi:replicative DNA helicase
MIETMETTTGSPNVDLKKTAHKPNSFANPLKVDRLPPHSIEAEQGVLGCALLSPNECMGECIEKLKAASTVFYDLRHRTVYEAMVEMYDHKEAIDLITLSQRLKDGRQLDAVGGLPYLSSLPDAVPSAANLSYYLNIVREKFILR